MCKTGLIGYNTDGYGLVDALLTELDFFPGEEQILVIGAAQGERAFEIWTGNKSPEGVMRQALDGFIHPSTA